MTVQQLGTRFNLSWNAYGLLLAVLLIASGEHGGREAIGFLHQFATDPLNEEQISTYLGNHSPESPISGSSLYHMLTDRAFLGDVGRAYSERVPLTVEEQNLLAIFIIK